MDIERKRDWGMPVMDEPYEEGQDAATEAFARLWAGDTPDCTETLGALQQRVSAIDQMLSQCPALAITPEDMARRISTGERSHGRGQRFTAGSRRRIFGQINIAPHGERTEARLRLRLELKHDRNRTLLVPPLDMTEEPIEKRFSEHRPSSEHLAQLAA